VKLQKNHTSLDFAICTTWNTKLELSVIRGVKEPGLRIKRKRGRKSLGNREEPFYYV